MGAPSHFMREHLPAYYSWASMIARCCYKKSFMYPRYGGNGITVCDRWRSFRNFLEDMGDKPPGLTIDRIDNTKGYFHSNCRWATQKEQQRNKSNNRNITFNGKTQTSRAWEEELGMKRGIIASRLHYGWSEERAVSTPTDRLLQQKRAPS